MLSKTPLYTIAVPSTDFLTEGYFDGHYENGVSPAIRFSYEKEGETIESGLKFSRVVAVRMRAERSCTKWHIEDAYDTLVEVEDSSWVKEIYADTQKQWQDKWEMHHYMIYLDSVGCFEVIAETWATI
jgi:hypothetical protein